MRRARSARQNRCIYCSSDRGVPPRNAKVVRIEGNVIRDLFIRLSLIKGREFYHCYVKVQRFGSFPRKLSILSAFSGISDKPVEESVNARATSIILLTIR